MLSGLKLISLNFWLMGIIMVMGLKKKGGVYVLVCMIFKNEF